MILHSHCVIHQIRMFPNFHQINLLHFEIYCFISWDDGIRKAKIKEQGGGRPGRREGVLIKQNLDRYSGLQIRRESENRNLLRFA